MPVAAAGARAMPLACRRDQPGDVRVRPPRGDADPRRRRAPERRRRVGRGDPAAPAGVRARRHLHQARPARRPAPGRRARHAPGRAPRAARRAGAGARRRPHGRRRALRPERDGAAPERLGGGGVLRPLLRHRRAASRPRGRRDLPALVRSDANLAPVVDRLRDEHLAIHDAVQAVDRALVDHSTTPASYAGIQAAIDFLTDALLSTSPTRSTRSSSRSPGSASTPARSRRSLPYSRGGSAACAVRPQRGRSRTSSARRRSSPRSATESGRRSCSATTRSCGAGSCGTRATRSTRPGTASSRASTARPAPSAAPAPSPMQSRRWACRSAPGSTPANARWWTGRWAASVRARRQRHSQGPAGRVAGLRRRAARQRSLTAPLTRCGSTSSSSGAGNPM